MCVCFLFPPPSLPMSFTECGYTLYAVNNNNTTNNNNVQMPLYADTEAVC